MTVAALCDHTWRFSNPLTSCVHEFATLIQICIIFQARIIFAKKVKGYGTRLMNCLKQAARDCDQLSRLLTFADNKATSFFVKNGFSQQITVPRDFYAGFLKEYEFAAPMECLLWEQVGHCCTLLRVSVHVVLESLASWDETSC